MTVKSAYKDIDTLLIIQELKDLKDSLTRKNMIEDSQIEALGKNIEMLWEIVDEFKEELSQFKADRKVCGQLNLLVDHKPETNDNQKHREKDEPTLIDKLLQ